ATAWFVAGGGALDVREVQRKNRRLPRYASHRSRGCSKWQTSFDWLRARTTLQRHLVQAPFDSELKTRTSARRGAAQVTGAVWVAAATFALAPQVRAESEARCPITYEAPDACPNAAAMAKAAGPHFRVVSGS